jgi:hypothetical protein
MALKLTTSNKSRRPYLSRRVRAGLAEIADASRPETVEAIAAVSWIRRTIAVVESRHRRQHDAGRATPPAVDPR